MHGSQSVLSLCVLCLIGCGGGGYGSTGPPGGPGGAGGAGGAGARITYRLANGSVYRIEPAAGAAPQDVSAALNSLSPGADTWINTSADGKWLLLATERFDPSCVGFECLAIVKSDLSSGEVIRVAGDVVHPQGFSAIASSGNLVVYEDGGGAHARDLWAVTRTGTNWSAPLQLTGGSSFDFNSHPSLSADGSKILFDCGDQPYGAQGTAICEVRTNATSFRVVVRPSDSPAGLPDVAALHHAAYAPDGSIVFESDWAGEQIWRLAAGAAAPAAVSAQATNDNSPCVLSDGRIVSLWLSRAGNTAGLHEMKVMASDGAAFIMALTGVDVADIGIGCGG